MTLVNAETGEVVESLEHLEGVIERGLGAFFEVGDALRQINGAKLYRHSYATFEDYCIERWSLSRPRAYELMAAADVVETLSAIADTPLPKNEAQARALAPVKDKPDVMADAMRRAAATAPPTARSIAAAVEELVAEETEKAVERKEDAAAISDLNVLAEAAGIDGDPQRQAARAELSRSCKAIYGAGSPHAFLVGQAGQLMPRHKQYVIAAHRWLTDLLEEWGD